MTDNGTSINMDGSTKVTSAAGILGTPSGNKGSYNLFNFQNFVDDIGSSISLKTSGSSLPAPSGGGTTKYFQMVGYYSTGAVYEAFVVTGTPAPPTTTNPNTGHTLVNTYVASFWAI